MAIKFYAHPALKYNNTLCIDLTNADLQMISLYAPNVLRNATNLINANKFAQLCVFQGL